MGRFLEWLVVGLLAKWFPKRYRVVPRITDGEPMIRQFKLTSWCYLQSFRVADANDLFHCHRWRRMVSFVLSGAILEERYPGNYRLMHMAPSPYSMDGTNIHRIDRVLPNTWTLFMFWGQAQQFPTSYSKDRWGYYLRPMADCNFIPAESMIPPEMRVPSL